MALSRHKLVSLLNFSAVLCGLFSLRPLRFRLLQKPVCLTSYPKLKASTLIEALVAMVIIVVGFGIGMTVFGNVTGSSAMHQKARAELLLQELSQQAKDKKDFLDGSTEIKGIKIEKKVLPSGAEGMSILMLTASDENNRKLAEHKEIIFSE